MEKKEKEMISEEFRNKMMRLSGVINEGNREDFLYKSFSNFIIQKRREVMPTIASGIEHAGTDDKFINLLKNGQGDLKTLFVTFKDEKEEAKKIAEVFKKLSETDPTAHKEYLTWIVYLFRTNRIKIEDLYKVKEDLEFFDKIKHRLVVNHKTQDTITDKEGNESKIDKEINLRDINQYKDMDQLYSVLEPFYSSKNALSKSEEMKTVKLKGADKVFEDANWTIITPLNKDASCLYGKGTRWCTASVSSNHFDYYNKQGLLYILINKKKGSEKYQFHFETSQFMDTADRQINVGEFMRNNPDVVNFFKHIGKIDKGFLLKYKAFSKEESLQILTDIKEQPTLISKYGLEWFLGYFIELKETEVLKGILKTPKFLQNLAKSGTILDMFRYLDDKGGTGALNDFIQYAITEVETAQYLKDYAIGECKKIKLGDTERKDNNHVDNLSRFLKYLINSGQQGYDFAYEIAKPFSDLYQEFNKQKLLAYYLTICPSGISDANMWKPEVFKYVVDLINNNKVFIKDLLHSMDKDEFETLKEFIQMEYNEIGVPSIKKQDKK